MKKALALILSLIMILSLGVFVFADNSDGESYITGSITITNPQEEVTYKAYKIFDVTYADSKYAYTIDPEWIDDVVGYATPAGTTLEDGWTTTTANGLTVTKNAIDGYNVTVDNNFSAADFGEKMAEKTSGKTAVAFVDGVAEDLDLGYYMVQPTTANSLVSLTTTDADVQITDKNEKPVPDKKLVGENPILVCEKEIHTHDESCYTGDVLSCGKDEHAHSEANGCYKEKDFTTKSVGDKVDFEVDTKVPDMTGYKTYFFVLNDTMSKGLNFNGDVAVSIDGTTIGTEKYTVKVTDIDGATNIRIVFNEMTQWQEKAGAPIVVTYSATLDEDAAMGTAGNPNTVYLEYSNNPNFVPEWTDPQNPGEDPNDPLDPQYKHNDPTYTGDDPVGKSVEDKVTVYTTELDITKIDGAARDTKLTGAKFKIEGQMLNVSIVNKVIFKEDANGTWYRLKDGTYTQDVPAAKDASTDPTYTEFSGEKITYTELTGANAVPGVGLYYSEAGSTEKVLITENNLASVPNDATIYQPTYMNVGLYYLGGATYVEVTEANASEHLTDTLYTKTEYKQSDLYEDTTKKYVQIEEITKETTSKDYTAEGWVDENGLITFTGLAEGTYYLTELVAPDGYNLLKAPVEVVVKLVEGETVGSYKFQATVDGAATPIEEAAGVLSFDIENNQGIELPETGGMGTVLFIAIGAVLFVAAGIILTAKKRLYNEG